MTLQCLSNGLMGEFFSSLWNVSTPHPTISLWSVSNSLSSCSPHWIILQTPTSSSIPFNLHPSEKIPSTFSLSWCTCRASAHFSYISFLGPKKPNVFLHWYCMLITWIVLLELVPPSYSHKCHSCCFLMLLSVWLYCPLSFLYIVSFSSSLWHLLKYQCLEVLRLVTATISCNWLTCSSCLLKCDMSNNK